MYLDNYRVLLFVWKQNACDNQHPPLQNISSVSLILPYTSNTRVVLCFPICTEANGSFEYISAYNPACDYGPGSLRNEIPFFPVCLLPSSRPSLAKSTASSFYSQRFSKDKNSFQVQEEEEKKSLQYKQWKSKFHLRKENRFP